MSKMPEQIVKPFCNFCIRQFWSIGLEVKSDWRDDHSVRVDMINHAVGAALSHLSLNPDANFEEVSFRVRDLVAGIRIRFNLLQCTRDIGLEGSKFL